MFEFSLFTIPSLYSSKHSKVPEKRSGKVAAGADLNAMGGETQTKGFCRPPDKIHEDIHVTEFKLCNE